MSARTLIERCGSLALVLAIGALASAADEPTWPGMTRAGSVLLPNGWSLLPAGRQAPLGDFPVTMAVHPTEPILAVLHEPFCWHGYVLIAPVLALSLSEKKPLWVQIALAGWFVYALQTFFAYPPFFFFDELARFFANHGNPPRY